MRLFLIDPPGNGVDIALRARDAGHDVKVFITQKPKTEHIGRGLFTIVEDFKPWLRWADLIFNTDNSKYLRDLDAFRAEFPDARVISASQETAAWEKDRDRGQQVLKAAGIQVIPGRSFADYDKAIAFVKKESRRFVSKPSGDVEDKALSYVSKSPADMVYMLERWKKLGKHKAPFILQEAVDGTEMAVGGWFGPHGFNAGYCENWEFKKLMDGDRGVATGEQGTVVRYTRSSKLARQVLKPVEEALHKAAYVGYVDVNCIIDDKGIPWPLEFTMRPGWPTFNIQQALHDGDPVEWLKDLADGTDARVSLMDRVAMGVVLSIPDYPYSHLTRKEVIGAPIYGLTPRLKKHVHFCEVMLGTAPNDVDGKVVNLPSMVTAGDYVLVMSGTAETVSLAKRKVYRRLEQLSLPSSPMYRTDIGDRLSKQLPKLQAMGYAMGMEF